MARSIRFAMLFAILSVTALSSYAQNSPLVGTVIDVDEGRGRLQIEADTDAATRVTIETDAVTTTYYGFGGVIAGKPEIFNGSKGLSNVRLGDRVEVRGATRAEGIIKADRVSLLGRSVAAGSVGVGSTRDPVNGVATPTDDRASGQMTVAATVEGTIRQINADDGRIVVQTTQRRMMTIRTTRNTPVIYRGESYRTSNLEVGDVIRVETDARTSQNDEVYARRIEVTRSVQETGSTPGTGGLVTTLTGRVARVESGQDTIYVDADNRTQVRVDMGEAEDARGDAVRAADLRVGDRIEISGSYNRAGDRFLASTVRFVTGTTNEPPIDDFEQYGLVTVTGTVTETLEDASTISLRDRDSRRVLRLWVANDFVVRTKGNTYTTAEQIRENDTVIVEAFRDAGGNLIAQTIRLRNR